MPDTTQQIAAKIAGEVITLARQIMHDNGVNPKTGRNTLRESALLQAGSVIETSGNGSFIIRTLFGNYIRYIEQGRAPRQGKMPPIDALREWASEKGLPTDNNTLWAIAYAIWRDGYAGRPILSLLEKAIDKKWNDSWADAIIQPLIDEIDKKLITHNCLASLHPPRLTATAGFATAIITSNNS